MEKFYVYKITNLINRKCYIGSTKHPEKRKKEHFNAANQEKNPSYNYPLQKAIRKYGKENFLFEIICNANTSDKIILLEREYIEKYNSLTNIGHGYNQTAYTDCPFRDPEIKQAYIEKYGKRCALVDENKQILEMFESYHDAGRQYKCDAKSISKVCNGLQEHLKNKLFRNIDDENNIVEPEIKFLYRVAQIDPITKTIIKIFKDKREAAIKVTNNENNRNSILKCIQGDKKYSTVGGYIWREVDSYNDIIHNIISFDMIGKINGCKQKIAKIDPTTQEIIYIFNCQKDAAKDLQVSVVTLQKHLDKGSYKGYLWRRL